MRVLDYTVPESCAEKTVKDFIRYKLGFSARFLTKQKQTAGGILKNGAPCRATEPILPGDVLTLRLPEETGRYLAVDLPSSVLWETEDYLAMNKPPFMPIHPSPGHDSDSLLNAVAFHYEATGQSCMFRPIYRLDRDTSGIVLIGKHRAAVSAAKLRKRYYAVCQGDLSGSGVIDLPIGLKPGSKILRECGHGERAVTRWWALASCTGHTLLALELGTGRTHQIRVHLSALGHPLAGDELYGGSRELIGRQALHCGYVRLSCPALDTEREICAVFPPDLREAFPWLPEMETLNKEELQCQPV